MRKPLVLIGICAGGFLLYKVMKIAAEVVSKELDYLSEQEKESRDSEKEKKE